MYSLLDNEHGMPQPQSHVTFHVKERVNRVCSFFSVNFLLVFQLHNYACNDVVFLSHFAREHSCLSGGTE